jgi:hypothetical protein
VRSFFSMGVAITDSVATAINRCGVGDAGGETKDVALSGWTRQMTGVECSDRIGPVDVGQVSVPGAAGAGVYESRREIVAV